MTRGKHSLPPRQSKYRRISLLAAPAVTAAVVGVGVATTDLGPGTADPAPFAGGSISAAQLADRTTPMSRDSDRMAPPSLTAQNAPATANDHLWTTEDLLVRAAPRKDAKTFGEVDVASRVGVTGIRENGFAQIVIKGSLRWVSAAYLDEKKPSGPDALPIVSRPCAGTSGVESGLTPRAIRVYRAVCNNFPQITRYGGRSGHGEHRAGRAIDIMTSDVALGTRIAEFLRANARTFDIYDVIWRQRIFTQQRGGEGWRPMSNRGSATANHYDHVHVSVY